MAMQTFLERRDAIEQVSEAGATMNEVAPARGQWVSGQQDQARALAARIIAALKSANLRPTRQRVALGALLFRGGHRHVTADELQRDAASARISLSLATVYNTLNQFAEAGLIRRVAIAEDRTYFDTDIGDHQHFYVEGEGTIIDVPSGSIGLGMLPEPPDGYQISHVDIVIRLVRKSDPTPQAHGRPRSAVARRGNEE
jgi:Fur family iron response transcriptional regulator